MSDYFSNGPSPRNNQIILPIVLAELFNQIAECYRVLRTTIYEAGLAVPSQLLNLSEREQKLHRQDAP